MPIDFKIWMWQNGEPGGSLGYFGVRIRQQKASRWRSSSSLPFLIDESSRKSSRYHPFILHVVGDHACCFFWSQCFCWCYKAFRAVPFQLSSYLSWLFVSMERSLAWYATIGSSLIRIHKTIVSMYNDKRLLPPAMIVTNTHGTA